MARRGLTNHRSIIPAAVGDAPAESAADDDEPVPVCRAIALPADLLDALRTLDPVRLRPDAKLYVHLHEAILTGAVPGVARVEDLGPHLLAQVRDLLAHANVTTVPVIDLNQLVSVNAYDHPEALA